MAGACSLFTRLFASDRFGSFQPRLHALGLSAYEAMRYSDFTMPVGAITTITAGASSFLLYAIPMLQLISLIISVVAGILTIVHYLRSK